MAGVRMNAQPVYISIRHNPCSTEHRISPVFVLFTEISFPHNSENTPWCNTKLSEITFDKHLYHFLK